MKKITEMTELEILSLKNEDVEKLQRLAMAEAGIALLDKPKVPELFEIEPTDLNVYSINLLGTDFGFTDMDEAKELLEFFVKAKSFAWVETDYSRLGGDYPYIRREKKRKYSYGNGDLNINPRRVYSPEKYKEIADFATQNKKMQEQAAKDQKEYDSNMASASEIISEIREKWCNVVAKYERLDRLVGTFKDKYLPLADTSDIAMNFMKLAFSLTDEECDYILTNYKKEQAD